MKNYVHYIDKFSKARILVIGDLIVDNFVYGTVSRISPEAPVPVVEVTKETSMPGGAGNVANNLASLGGKVYVCAVVGDDIAGNNMLGKLSSLDIDTNGVFVDNLRPTTLKTRIIAQHQQIVRFDRESKKEISGKAISKIIDYADEISREIDAILISDYGKGVINHRILKEIINLANRRDIPVTVDPKIEHFLSYRNVTSMTPNLQEALQGMKVYKKDVTLEDIKDLGFRMLKELHNKSIIITLGESGMAIFEKNNKCTFIHTKAKEVFDVSGAGDTVIAVLTLCLAGGTSLLISAEIANYAAGIVVGKLGTATVNVEELKEAILNH